MKLFFLVLFLVTSTACGSECETGDVGCSDPDVVQCVDGAWEIVASCEGIWVSTVNFADGSSATLDTGACRVVAGPVAECYDWSAP